MLDYLFSAKPLEEKSFVSFREGNDKSRDILEALSKQKGNFFCLLLSSSPNEAFVIKCSNVEKELRAFARLSALSVRSLWEMPKVVREFLETGKAELREASAASASSASASAASASASASAYAAAYAASASASASAYASASASASASAYAATYAASASASAYAYAAASAAAASASAAKKQESRELLTSLLMVCPEKSQNA